MNISVSEFLRDAWATASPNQYGSRTNPFVAEAPGQRLSNGQRVGGMGQTQPIGTTPEVPITASTIGVPAPDCGPKMQAVIDPNTGRWICQPVSSGPGIGQLAVIGVLGYLAYQWWKGQEKHKTSHKSISEERDDD